VRANSTLTLPLRENLLAVLGGAYTSKQLNGLINLCVALATELLCRKSTSRKLSSLQGLNEKDLAYDAIADLFQRDAQGNFIQLDAYFSGFDLQTISDEELLIALRRLVYSRVNQALFRMYHDIDPAFARILRNIKLAIETMKQFDEFDRFGEPSIAPALCDTLEHLPALEPDEVKRHLLSVCFGNENIPQLLGKLAVFLKQQECNSRILPLISVASIFQSVYAIKNEPLLAPAAVEMEFAPNDIVETIKSVCRTVQADTRRKYLEKKNVGEDVFRTYFDIIERTLLARFVENNGELSYFDLLKSRLPDLTPAEYKKLHRAKLEYLGALTQKLAIKRLKTLA
jgi:hypothetical protein